MTRDPAILAAALDYAAWGIPVFPCSPDNKQPLTPKESAPGAKDGGLYLATCDAQQIRAWWQRFPKAMIGVPTGAASKMLVIDLDPRTHAAEDMQAALQRWLGEPLDCAVSRTQSGGLHLVFAMPDEPLGNRAGLFRKIADAPPEIREHVDVRATGGYIIAPPSVMVTGTYYEWLRPLEACGLVAAPGRLVDAVAKRLDGTSAPEEAARPPAGPSAGSDRVEDNRRKYGLAALDRQRNDLARQGEGGRNSALNVAAFTLGTLVGAGVLSESMVRGALWEACQQNGLVKDDGAESVRKTLDSGLQDGMSRPADVSRIGVGRGDRPKPRPSRQPAAADPAPPPAEDAEEVGPEPLIPETLHDGEIDWDVLQRCAAEDQNDVGNARRLMHRHGQDILHIQNVDFFAFDGKRWKEDVDGVNTLPMCHATAHAIRLEPLVIKPSDEEQVVVERGRLAKKDLAQQESEYLTLAGGEPSEERATRLEALKISIETLKAEVRAGQAITIRLAAIRASRSKYSVSSGNTGKLAGMLAQATPYISRNMDTMDAEACAINVSNGTLRFDQPDGGRAYRVARHPHARTDYMTKIMDVDWDPAATCPLFTAVIERILPNEAVRSFVQRYFGYAMTALDREQVFAIFHGEGRNGKSTLVDIIASIMGDYSVSLPVSSLVNENKGGKGAEATPDLARLPGARLVRTAEPKEGMAFDESLIKGLTSGEPLPVRRLHKDFIDVYPTFKIVISANRKPVIRGNDDGIWRRVMLVPFDVQIPEDEIDRTLPDKLQFEKSGILNWLLEGTCAYLEAGLLPPEEVKAATREFREESDIVGGFVQAALTVTRNEADMIAAGVMYNAFVVYCQKQGIPPLNGHTFGRRIKKSALQFGFTPHKSSLQYYVGVTIKAAFQPEHGRHERRGGDEDPHD